MLKEKIGKEELPKRSRKMNKIISVKNKCIQTKKIAGFIFSDEAFSQLKEKVIGKKLMLSNGNEVRNWIGNVLEVTDDGFKVEVVNPEFEDIVYDGMSVSLDILTLNDDQEIQEIYKVNRVVVKPSNQFNEVEIKSMK